MAAGGEEEEEEEEEEEAEEEEEVGEVETPAVGSAARAPADASSSSLACGSSTLASGPEILKAWESKAAADLERKAAKRGCAGREAREGDDEAAGAASSMSGDQRSAGTPATGSLPAKRDPRKKGEGAESPPGDSPGRLQEKPRMATGSLPVFPRERRGGGGEMEEGKGGE